MECIFCQIVEKKIPAHVVYEDTEFLAFLDIHPLSPGHTLIIPKKHYRWVWDVPNAGTYFEVAQKIAKAQQQVFTEAVRSRTVGDEVAHAHIWVFPDPETTEGDKLDFSHNAEVLRSALN